MEGENIIEMLHITKEFPGIIANDDITLQLRKGEIHALLGENGAGKSTLMKILTGVITKDGGTVEMNGKGFSAMVSEGRSVEKGEPEFSQEEIRAARPV